MVAVAVAAAAAGGKGQECGGKSGTRYMYELRVRVKSWEFTSLLPFPTHVRAYRTLARVLLVLSLSLSS